MYSTLINIAQTKNAFSLSHSKNLSKQLFLQIRKHPFFYFFNYFTICKLTEDNKELLKT